MSVLLNKLTGSPKYLFLVDASGAALTAILLAGILAPLEHVFGMPKNYVYILFFIACVFACYSMCCYLLVRDKFRPWLRIIIAGNAAYCCFTMLLVIHFSERLSRPGLLYFLLEMLVICVLLSVELKVLRTKNELPT